MPIKIQALLLRHILNIKNQYHKQFNIISPLKGNFQRNYFFVDSRVSKEDNARSRVVQLA